MGGQIAALGVGLVVEDVVAPLACLEHLCEVALQEDVLGHDRDEDGDSHDDPPANSHAPVETQAHQRLPDCGRYAANLRGPADVVQHDRDHLQKLVQQQGLLDSKATGEVGCGGISRGAGDDRDRVLACVEEREYKQAYMKSLFSIIFHSVYQQKERGGLGERSAWTWPRRWP